MEVGDGWGCCALSVVLSLTSDISGHHKALNEQLERRASPTLKRQLLHIQHRNLDPPLGEQLHHDLSNAIAAARHHHNLLAPVIRIGAPVVQHPVVEPAAHGAQRAQRKQRLEVLECGCVLGGEQVALCCVAREQDEREGQRGVEGRVFECPAEGVAGYACDLV